MKRLLSHLPRALRAQPPPFIVSMVGRPVRQFITAGGAADRNRDDYIDGSELGMFPKENVADYSNGPHRAGCSFRSTTAVGGIRRTADGGSTRRTVKNTARRGRCGA